MTIAIQKPDDDELIAAEAASSDDTRPRNNGNATKGELINTNVQFVDQDMLMQDVVAMMIDQNISSVLVTDHDENIVGILTERDIVRKFTLLEMADKLARKVSVVMARPVHFVQTKTLKQDITKLHLEHKFRHFPVLSGKEAKKQHVVGIVSITDLARQALLASASKPSIDEDLTKRKIAVGVMCHHPGTGSIYLDLFKGIGFEARMVFDLHKYLSAPNASERALIFDMDGYTERQLHELIPVCVKSRAYLFLTTSNPNLIQLYKKYLQKDRQEIAIKPLDMSYISWMLTRKWAGKAG